MLALLFGVVWLAGSRGRVVRRAPTWTCGILPEPSFEWNDTMAFHAPGVNCVAGMLSVPHCVELASGVAGLLEVRVTPFLVIDNVQVPDVVEMLGANAATSAA